MSSLAELVECIRAFDGQEVCSRLPHIIRVPLWGDDCWSPSDSVDGESYHGSLLWGEGGSVSSILPLLHVLFLNSSAF